jgi:threo-3-hydroxy-L-aspartate ammonia-lyase
MRNSGAKNMVISVATIGDVQAAQSVIRQHISAVPLIRSYALEKELRLPPSRRAWLKDFGSTPVGSFKVFGALNWLARNLERIGEKPITACSSGNFASGLAYAGMRYKKRVVIVMPDTAPKVKFERTRSFGAEIRTYDMAQDHVTGERERLTREIANEIGAIQAFPYDNNDVIAGNGVGGLEIEQELKRDNRGLSHFYCPISGGGLMAGHALAIANGFPQAAIMGVEPDGADDFSRSLQTGERVRLNQPQSICDGLLSYDVGEHNWPILKQFVRSSISVADDATRRAMRWLYDQHGLRAEPSGAIALAAAMTGQLSADGDGDIVIVVSGRNVDEASFQNWITNV